MKTTPKFILKEQVTMGKKSLFLKLSSMMAKAM